MVCFGQGQNARVEDIIFDVVDINYPYNAIIGRAMQNAFEVILHSTYLAMKILIKYEVITIFGSQRDARKAEDTQTPQSKQVNVLKEKAEKQQQKPLSDKAESSKATKKLPLNPNIVDQQVILRMSLSEQEEEKLIGFLRSNKDVFAWSAKDLCSISRSIIEHSLCVNPSAMPKRRALRKMSKDIAEGAKFEVYKLFEAGVIRPIDYTVDYKHCYGEKGK